LNAPAASSPFVFSAGESSGDLLAAPVVQALQAARPEVQVAGIAGDRMMAAGCEAWFHVRELSVRGYAEVLRELPRLLALRRSLRDRVLAQRARVFVGVDAPDFNLKLECWLRAAGVPTVHYVSPSIWAWRRERIENIRRAASRVLLVFPFEQAIYAQAGIAATYVGHPLAAQIPQVPDARAARARLGLPLDLPVVALLPGSRRAEIEYIAPAFLGAAELLREREPRMSFVLPIADPALGDKLRSMLTAFAGLAANVRLVYGQSHDCLEAADGVLVASGTATLEAALFKRPMVIAYRMPRFSWWLMKGRGYLPWVGLPNILAREFVVPELLQAAMTPRALADALTEQMNADPAPRRERFLAMHRELARDTPALAAGAILETAGA
jgi:lipid-A-disaccharide synthase